jgi:hypothetical protein
MTNRCGEQKIVHIDDSGMIRAIFRLSCKGGITTYNNHTEAVGEVWAHKDADLFVVDIALGEEKTGVDYVKKLLKLYPECEGKIAFMTAMDYKSADAIEARKLAPVIDKKVLRDPELLKKHICSICGGLGK